MADSAFTQKGLSGYSGFSGFSGAEGGFTYGLDSGSTDTYAITLDPAPDSYEVGESYLFRANTANTGAATLNVNTLGAVTIYKQADNTLASNDILAQQMVLVSYNELSTTVDSYASSNYDGEWWFDGTQYGIAQSFTGTATRLTSCLLF